MNNLILKCVTLWMLVFCSAMAHADGGRLAAPKDPKWKAECGSCHIAYPPGLLSKDNWQRLMGGLDKHFGVNAVMDANDNKLILNFLQKNAGNGNKFSTSSLRISETPWFTHEHNEISTIVWSDSRVKSRSNCTACHVNAEHGEWSEHGVRMPAGYRHDD